jgi:hypothetical protein
MSPQLRAAVRLRSPIHAHNIRRVKSCRAPRAFLTGFHLGGFSRRNHNPFHGVRADGTVNKSLGLVLAHWLGDQRLRLSASLNVHDSSFFNA